MIILYIPFSFEDSLSDLQAKAQKWTEAYQLKGKDVVTVIHDWPSRYSDQIKEALQKGDCKIYVLSHGINTPDFKVANQTVDNEDYRELTIQEVAEHFKSDLMTSEFSNENIIKLFFCDEYAQDKKSRRMAEEFRSQLGELHQTLEIKYYTDVSIGRPGSSLDSQMGAKKAVRSCKMSNDLICFDLSCLVGKAKSFREGLNEGEKPLSFFSNTNSPQVEIKLPKFSHPILQNLAKGLLYSISNDKILSKHPYLAQEVLSLLPTDLSFYLVDGLKMASNNIILEMKINKPALEVFLQKMGVVLPEQSIASKSSKKESISGWIDEDDFLGSSNTSYKKLDDSVSFLNLDDYDEVLQSSESRDTSLKI